MIMITGGMGFLGGSMAKLLCEQGQKVLLTVHRQKELAPFLEQYRDKNLFMSPLDITNLEEVEKTIRNHGVESIIHAASSYEAKGNLYDAMRVNVLGTINILEVSVRAGMGRVSAISTEAVYQGIKQTEPLKEEQLLSVESDRYVPGTKRAEENLAMLYATKAGLDVVLIRASRIYGPLFTGVRSPMHRIAQSAVDGAPCELTHIDEAEGHDNIYVKDCARGVIMIHTRGKLKHRIYNLGMGKLTTFGEIRDAAQKVSPTAKISLGKNLGDITATKSALDINACLDITRIRQELAFEPEYDIEKGISAYVAWLKDKIYL
ncbi:MAG: NAD(P)-dependent oxidoreductase [Syntrophorhabdales bacterium]